MNREFVGKDVTILYDKERCIHAEVCVHTAGAVFNKAGVNADGERPGGIAAVIQRCPTGALHYTPADAALAQRAATTNTMVTTPRGPLFVRGNLEVLPAGKENKPLQDTRAALCRCGASANKPLCDGSHHRAGFDDLGMSGPQPDQEKPLGPEQTLKVAATPNGPLHAEGAFLIKNAAGETVFAGADAWLCRCGHSGKKPFCDGSHLRVGFQDS